QQYIVNLLIYGMGLASVFRFFPEIVPKIPYNGLFLRLYGLNWGSQKVWLLRAEREQPGNMAICVWFFSCCCSTIQPTYAKQTPGKNDSGNPQRAGRSDARTGPV